MIYRNAVGASHRRRRRRRRAGTRRTIGLGRPTIAVRLGDVRASPLDRWRADGRAAEGGTGVHLDRVRRARGSSRVRDAEPRRAFGWATRFGPSAGDRSRCATGRSSPPRSRRGCSRCVWMAALWITRKPVATMRARGSGLADDRAGGRGRRRRSSARATWARRRPRRRPGRGAVSGAWFCPHGGGQDWEASVYLANPGDTDVDGAAHHPGRGALGSCRQAVTVPPGGQVRSSPVALRRGSSTYVEYFGGWIAAGWVRARRLRARPGSGPSRALPTAGRSWFATGVSTEQGEEAVPDGDEPVRADAVFDVALFAARRAAGPRFRAHRRHAAIRAGAWRSARTAFAEGEAAVGVEVDVSLRTGRRRPPRSCRTDRGISSVLASPATARTVVPARRSGAGQSHAVAVRAHRARERRVARRCCSPTGQPRPVAELDGGRPRSPRRAAIFPVTPTGPSSVDVSVQEGVPSWRRCGPQGPGSDDAATGGAVEPASAWVVPPTRRGRARAARLLLVNPGDTEVTVTLRLLPPDGGDGEPRSTLTFRRAVGDAVPAEFLEAPRTRPCSSRPTAPVIALGASTSLGRRDFGLRSRGGRARYPTGTAIEPAGPTGTVPRRAVAYHVADPSPEAERTNPWPKVDTLPASHACRLIVALRRRRARARGGGAARGLPVRAGPRATRSCPASRSPASTSAA